MALTQQFTAGSTLTATKLNESSIPVVTSTSDISSPFAGQIIFNATDARLWRYTGSAWVIYLGGPTFQVRRAAATPTTNGATHVVTWDTEDNDTSGMFSAPSQTLTVQQPGLYSLGGKIGWNTHATGGTLRAVWVSHNGASLIGSEARAAAVANHFSAVSIPPVFVQLSLGDTLQVACFQQSGSTLDLDSRLVGQSVFSGVWLHD